MIQLGHCLNLQLPFMCICVILLALTGRCSLCTHGFLALRKHRATYQESVKVEDCRGRHTLKLRHKSTFQRIDLLNRYV